MLKLVRTKMRSTTEQDRHPKTDLNKFTKSFIFQHLANNSFSIHNFKIILYRYKGNINNRKSIIETY